MVIWYYLKMSCCLNWNRYLRVASEEPVGSSSQEARGEDGTEGVGPQSHHHPGEDAGQGGGDQQLLGTKPQLEEPAGQGEYDGRNVLYYSNEGISQIVHLLTLVFHQVVVMFYQNGREVTVDTAENESFSS